MSQHAPAAQAADGEDDVALGVHLRHPWLDMAGRRLVWLNAGSLSSLAPLISKAPVAGGIAARIACSSTLSGAS